VPVYLAARALSSPSEWSSIVLPMAVERVRGPDGSNMFGD